MIQTTWGGTVPSNTANIVIAHDVSMWMIQDLVIHLLLTLVLG